MTQDRLDRRVPSESLATLAVQADTAKKVTRDPLDRVERRATSDLGEMLDPAVSRETRARTGTRVSVGAQDPEVRRVRWDPRVTKETRAILEPKATQARTAPRVTEASEVPQASSVPREAQGRLETLACPASRALKALQVRRVHAAMTGQLASLASEDTRVTQESSELLDGKAQSDFPGSPVALESAALLVRPAMPAQLARRVTRARGDQMERTDQLASWDRPATLERRVTPDPEVTRDRLDLPEPLGRPDSPELPVGREPRVTGVTRETKVARADPARLETKVIKVMTDQLDRLEPRVLEDQTVRPVLVANPARPDRRVTEARRASQASRELLASRDPSDRLDSLVTQGPTA